MMKSTHGFSTRAIHDGQEADPLTGAVNVPIYLSSTYAQEEIGKNKGYEYARVSNPTRDALEANLASLEGGMSAHVFASGMAAGLADSAGVCADQAQALVQHMAGEVLRRACNPILVHGAPFLMRGVSKLTGHVGFGSSSCVQLPPD